MGAALSGGRVVVMEFISGWWFGTWILFSISYVGCHPSHWRTPAFFRGVETKPPTRYSEIL
jgi:hypothetical protein